MSLERDADSAKDTIDNLVSALGDLKSEIEEKDVEISKLENDLDCKDSEIDRLNDYINELEAEIKELKLKDNNLIL